jgi:IclR family acetate operon transcriptional repressor
MATPKNRSVQKAFSMLRAFTKPDEWLTSAELSRRAGLPEASGYRMVLTLLELGAVIRDNQGRYGPGMLLLTLSRNVAQDKLLRQFAGSRLERLANDLNLTVHMGVYDDGMVTYVAKVAAHDPIGVQTDVGIQLEAYCTGLGKVLLSGLPAYQFKSFLLEEGELIPLTARTITDPSAFRKEIERVRRQGWAIDDGEMDDDLRCIAVPVKDASGRIVAAISGSGLSTMMTDKKLDAIRPALMAAAAEIGQSLASVGPISSLGTSLERADLAFDTPGQMGSYFTDVPSFARAMPGRAARSH